MFCLGRGENWVFTKVLDTSVDIGMSIAYYFLLGLYY